MIQIILSCIPMLFFLFVLYFNKHKVKNILNLTIFGCSSLIIATALFRIISNYIPSINLYMDYGEGILRFIAIFIYVGLVEELAKYIPLKISKPKNKNEIFINAIYISLIFDIFENYAYIGDSNNQLKLGLYRAGTPLHVIFAIVMSYFLCLGYNSKQENKKVKFVIFEMLSIFVPSILHTIWDFYAIDISINNMGFALLTIMTIIIYGIFLFVILKLNKSDVQNKEEQKSSKKKSFLKIIVIILFVLFWFSTFDSNINEVKFNNTLKVDEENIEITVNKVEKFIVEDALFDKDNGTYVKVNVTIKNNNETVKNIPLINTWFLVDNNGETIEREYINSALKDQIFDIDANSEATGNIYFETPFNTDFKLLYKNAIYNQHEVITNSYKFELE